MHCLCMPGTTTADVRMTHCCALNFTCESTSRRCRFGAVDPPRPLPLPPSAQHHHTLEPPWAVSTHTASLLPPSLTSRSAPPFGAVAFSSLWAKLFAQPEVKLLILGLDSAGKSTILYKITMGEVVASAPTVGSNVEVRVGSARGRDEERTRGLSRARGKPGLQLQEYEVCHDRRVRTLRRCPLTSRRELILS